MLFLHFDSKRYNCIISGTNNVFEFNRVAGKSLKTHGHIKDTYVSLIVIKITTTPRHKNNAVGLYIKSEKY